MFRATCPEAQTPRTDRPQPRSRVDRRHSAARSAQPQRRTSPMVPRAPLRTIRGVRERLAPAWEEQNVNDPREIADWYAPYHGWSDMLGQGVRGIVLRKPA